MKNKNCGIYGIINMKSITNHTNIGKIMKDKFVGISKVGEKGQIVIPKEAREMFSINPGDSVVVLCDKKRGMAIMKSEVLEDKIEKIIPK